MEKSDKPQPIDIPFSKSTTSRQIIKDVSIDLQNALSKSAAIHCTNLSSGAFADTIMSILGTFTLSVLATIEHISKAEFGSAADQEALLEVLINRMQLTMRMKRNQKMN